MTHHPRPEDLSLLTLVLIPILVAMFHPLNITLSHMVFPARTPAVVITEHFLNEFVL